jgi:hypothetical protein
MARRRSWPKNVPKHHRKRRRRKRRRKRRMHCYTKKLEPNQNISVNWFPLYYS